MNARMLRQGDILLIRTETPEKHNQKDADLENGRIIIARGEKTGHTHSVDVESASIVRGLFKGLIDQKESEAGPILLLVEEDTQLVHDEHAPLALEKGAYEVRRQREYVPSRPPRRVID